MKSIFSLRSLGYAKTYVVLYFTFSVLGVLYLCVRPISKFNHSFPLRSQTKPIPNKLVLEQTGNPYSEEDLEKLTFFPWEKDHTNSKCRNFDTKFDTAHSLTPMALVSYPGSGNTWVRQLIEGSTGYFTGSVYSDKSIFSKGSYGEYSSADCNCTIVQKTHDFSMGIKDLHPPKDDVLKGFKGNGILIVRNPLKAIFSYRNFWTGGHTGLAPGSSFQGESWETIIKYSLITWKDLAITWINGINNGGVIFYENLVNEPSEELRRMILLIGLPLNEQRINCTLTHGAENFHRQSKPYPKSVYSKNVLMWAKLAVNSVQGALKKRGWPLLPLHHYEFLND